MSSDGFETYPLSDYKTSVCHLFINYVTVEEPWWWESVGVLGAYNKKVEVKFMELYHQVKQTNPIIYDSWEGVCSGDFEQYGYFIFDSRYIDQVPVKKYLLFPLYNYFLSTRTGSGNS